MKQNPDFCPAHPDDPRCGGGGRMDAAIDSETPDAPEGPPPCFGVDNYEVCLSSAPMGSLILSGAIDTTSTMCLQTQPQGWTTRGQPASCFIVAETVTVDDVSVSGSRPLVIVAGTSIQVNGTLDAAGHEAMPTKAPPGAPFLGSSCTAFGQTPTNSGSGAGGGAGGSFMTIAGIGGNGNNGMASNHGGTPAPAESTDPVALRGGCDGQPGGNGGLSGGIGGSGGGAVYLVAGATINFDASGIINASGGGGHASASQAGGGGGGSGGMIVLFAPNISAETARLLANGGGGASGTANGAGTGGTDPQPTTPLVQAGAVVGPMSCCSGAKGFAGTLMAETGGDGQSGQSGGGGGGGGGYIQSNKPLGAAVTSPAPTIK